MIRERLKEIRKINNNITQEEFAKKLKVPQSTYACYESGKSKLPDIVIDAICLKFNINEEWLRDGKEPRDKEMTKRELKIKQLEKVLEGKGDSLLHGIKIIVDMEPEEQKIVLDMGLKIHELHKNKEFIQRINKKV